MHRSWATLVLLLAAGSGGPAQGETPAREEIWEVAHVDGAKIGSVHTTIEPLERSTGRVRATWDLELLFRRHGSLVRLRMEQGTDEEKDGRVVAVFMRQHHGGGRLLNLQGVVEEDTLRVKIDKGDGSPRLDRALRWNSTVVGFAQMEQVFRQRKVKPGDRFTLLRYEPTLNSVLTVHVAVREPETVDVLGVRRSLTRVELTPDKLVAPGQTVQPAKMVWWLDGELTPLRRQMDLEGFGAVILTRTTKEIAQAAPGTAVRLPDLGLKALIPLDRAIPRPYATRSAIYRVTILDDPDPGTILVQDGHQHIANRKDATLELHVHPVAAAVRLDEVRPGRPGAEFLESCRYIDSGDERIQALARRAVGDEKDAWRKAVRIEKYVKGIVRVDQTAPLVPASQIAATPRGDCRHFAFLTTALCRAEGIPARTAIGLIYVFKGRPQMGFHMWTEVWIDGRWVGLDATLGRGGVSATHIKITDHSWYATESLTPFLPVQRVLGKIRLDVLRASEEGPPGP
jgi:hypothetical protein